jgi:hypothetical protein
LNKAATGAGLLSQEPELNYLVSSIRQEWDPMTQVYQYQLQSYTSKNEYFIFDIGSVINKKQSGLNQDEPQQINNKAFEAQSLGAILSKPMYSLNISIDYFIPIYHQDQILKTIQRCGEFTQPCQMPGARRKSSAASEGGG